VLGYGHAGHGGQYTSGRARELTRMSIHRC
jgi:hypothetical protein